MGGSSTGLKKRARVFPPTKWITRSLNAVVAIGGRYILRPVGEASVDSKMCKTLRARCALIPVSDDVSTDIRAFQSEQWMAAGVLERACQILIDQLCWRV